MFLSLSKVITFCVLAQQNKKNNIFGRFAKSHKYSNIDILGPAGKKCPSDIALNERGQEFTCEFSTSTVGEHSIEIVVGEKRLDNVTSKFYTYDASKINVGSIPPGFVGMPVEFESKYCSDQILTNMLSNSI